MQEIKNQDEFKLAVKKGVVVVDFFAQWCAPCKMVGPVLEELSNDMQGKVSFFKVDVDQCGEIASDYGITNIPAMVILKEGEKQEMIVGFKPKQVIQEILENYL